MNGTTEQRMTNIKIDGNNLYREESFTDLSFVTVRRLSPVKPDGSPDEARDPIFTAMTQLMSPNGPLPVTCFIEEAKTLVEAMEKLPDAIERTVRNMIAEAREMQRQEASKIVIPGR